MRKSAAIPRREGDCHVTTVMMNRPTHEALQKQRKERQELAASLACIPGGPELIAWFSGKPFGGAPEFGDAEIVSLLLDRKGPSQLRIALNCLGKSVVVCFELSNWIDAVLHGFSHQNVIAGLKLQRAGERNSQPWELGVGLEPGEWLIELEPCFGAHGTIRASIARITVE